MDKSKIRILVVDDERGLCAGIQEALRREGYRVEAATDAFVAVSLAEETPQVKAATNMITGMESGGGGTGKWAGNLAKTVLEPGIVQWTAQQIDRNWGGDWSKNKRDMSTLGNNLQAGIPFARNYLPLVQPKSSAPAAPRARQPKLKDYLEEAGRR